MDMFGFVREKKSYMAIKKPPLLMDSINLNIFSYNTEVESIFEHADQIWVGTRGAGVFIYEYNEKNK